MVTCVEEKIALRTRISDIGFANMDIVCEPDVQMRLPSFRLFSMGWPEKMADTTEVQHCLLHVWHIPLAVYNIQQKVAFIHLHMKT